jgi:hypothetical protein
MHMRRQCGQVPEWCVSRFGAYTKLVAPISAITFIAFLHSRVRFAQYRSPFTCIAFVHCRALFFLVFSHHPPPLRTFWYSTPPVHAVSGLWLRW